MFGMVAVSLIDCFIRGLLLHGSGSGHFQAGDCLTFARAEFLGFDAEVLQRLDPKVAERRRARCIVGDVTSVFETPSGDQNG